MLGVPGRRRRLVSARLFRLRHDEARPMDFAELHCLSNFSFLRGASHPEELVQQAAALGYRALALTDEFRFREADEEFHLVLLAPNRSAYGQLSALITLCRRRAPKGAYTARLRDFRWGGSECLALWIPGSVDIGRLMRQGKQLRALFPRLWIA